MPGETGDYRKLILGIVREVSEGRGPIYMDLSKMPLEDRDIVTKSYVMRGVKELIGSAPPPDKVPTRLFNNIWVWETCKKVGIDPFSVKMEVLPSLHGKSGPIRVNLEAATSVPGLWAVGLHRFQPLFPDLCQANRLRRQDYRGDGISGRGAAFQAQ